MHTVTEFEEVGIIIAQESWTGQNHNIWTTQLECYCREVIEREQNMINIVTKFEYTLNNMYSSYRVDNAKI